MTKPTKSEIKRGGNGIRSNDKRNNQKWRFELERARKKNQQ